VNPTVSGPLGTTNFKGATYNQYQIIWSAGQNWANGPSGQVPGGTAFHVGATFSSVNFSAPDPIIITNVVLLDALGNTLAQHPRHLGYDAATLDRADGALNVRFFNFNQGPLIIQDVMVQELPRVLSIEQMIPGGRSLDLFGDPIGAWPEGIHCLLQRSVIEKGQELKVAVARMNEKRHIYEVVDERSCLAGADRIRGPDTFKCRPGINVDLFPATTILLTATIVDPKARYWDPAQQRYVVGQLASHLFYQIAGRHPDLNSNGIDDYIDIKSGRSKDLNGNGVPDEVEHQTPAVPKGTSRRPGG
jgi:hypothetical protein